MTSTSELCSLERHPCDVEVKIEPSDDFNEEDENDDNQLEDFFIDPEVVQQCFICDGTSSVFPLAKRNKQKCSTSLCKLFCLPHIPYEQDFLESMYCTDCYQKILKLNSIYKQLEDLNYFITNLRADFEGCLLKSGSILNEKKTRLITRIGLHESPILNESKNEVYGLGVDENTPTDYNSLSSSHDDSIYRLPNVSSDDSKDNRFFSQDDDSWSPDALDIEESDTEKYELRSSRKNKKTYRKASQRSKVSTSSRKKIQKQAKNKNIVDNIIDNNHFMCQKCDCKFNNKNELNAHIKVEHKEKDALIVCQECGKTFQKPCLLKSHMLSHQTARPFMCEDCGKSFKTDNLLMSHRKNKHLEGGRQFGCSFCNKKFLTKQKMEAHTVYRHTKNFPIICEKCGKGFCSKAGLETHVQVEHENNRFRCPYENCGKNFKSKSTLTSHIDAHEGNYKAKCEVCGLGMRNLQHLKQHMNKHKGLKPYICEVCNKAFAYKSGLSSHVRTHAEIKPHKCDFCHKTFSRKDKLTNHRKVHTGLRPYQCQICNKCFYTEDFLNIHMGYHRAAQEQGQQGKINKAKIRRELPPGVSGARHSVKQISSSNGSNQHSSSAFYQQQFPPLGMYESSTLLTL